MPSPVTLLLVPPLVAGSAVRAYCSAALAVTRGLLR